MAGLNIGKIRLGKEQEKRNVFDLTHDVTLTADWGEVIPLMAREMIPNSKLSLSVDSFVRLAPMPLPTFGRASYRTFSTFVPLVEIWDAFESFMSKTSFTHGGDVYVPTQTPSLTQTSLTLQVLRNALVSAYKISQNATTGKQDLTFVTGTTELRNVVNAFKGLGIVANNILAVDLVFNEAYDKKSRITPFGADFKYEITVGSANDKYLLCFRLDPKMKRLRKILIGLGYQLQLMNGSQVTKVSALPLIAYYKAWFDLFAPQRDITWKQTHAYYLMEYIERTNNPNISTSIIMYNGAVKNYWYSFVDELTNCWFTDSVDYYAAHVTTPEVNSVANSWSTQGVAFGQLTSIGQGINAQPSINGIVSQAGLNVLKKMYAWANKNTIIGGKVAEYMRVHFGSDVLEDRKSNFIGNSNVAVQISDLYNQSQTSDAPNQRLGDFAGKGVGYGSSNALEFEADCYGYWITLCTIVPDSTYFQGLDPNLTHVSAEQFFTPAFDAVGFQVTPKACFVGDSDTESVISTTSYDNSASAGFIPRYSEYKVAQNVVNGDISLGSLKKGLLPYTLDKVISDNEVTVDGQVGETNYSGYTFTSNRSDVPAGTPEWRYIGKYGWLSNFNRIFYNDQESDNLSYYGRNDQFFIHNIMNVKLIAGMKQISDSFETESNEDSIEVQKQ